ncbi:MAG: hypothetical protein U9P49_07305 [Thermodesulfobacteriota bacterium]|nr:hypothetical protein [Thermodesulfobacteriota bacterium]
MGEKNSIVSLIILLLIFFVAPTILKLLGQHSLKHKQGLHHDEEENIITEGDEDEDLWQEPTEMSPISDISNKPIKPKWF